MSEFEVLALSVPDAAAKLGVGRNTLYAAVNRGDVPSIRIGRRLLIPTSALARFLEANVQADPLRANTAHVASTPTHPPVRRKDS
ncbi:MAG: helix-turn-helix domain-containing protein [Tepidiformaceae bacterium]